MIPVRPVELALLEVLTESNAGVETALDALAKERVLMPPSRRWIGGWGSGRATHFER